MTSEREDREVFDLAELERAHEIVGQAVPPTPAHAWPLLGAAARHARRGQAREPHADRRLQGARRAGLSRPAEAGAAEHARDHFRHARQSRAEPCLRRRPSRRSGGDLCAARQFGREEPRHARVRRRTGRAWRGLSGGRRRSRAPRPVRRPAHGAVVPSRPRARRRDLCARIAARGARSRRALCADRAGLGDLRLHHGARSARAAKPRSSACSRPKRRPTRCRLRPARS